MRRVCAACDRHYPLRAPASSGLTPDSDLHTLRLPITPFEVQRKAGAFNCPGTTYDYHRQGAKDAKDGNGEHLGNDESEDAEDDRTSLALS